MKFDDLLREIGEFSSYQKRVYFLTTFPIILAGFEALSVVFIFVIPPHRCAIPGFPDDQYAIINDTHAHLINASIPEDKDRESQWSQCLLYNNVTHDVILSNLSDSHLGRDNTSQCQKWVYDRSVFDNTIPMDFNMVCGHSGQRATSNMLTEMGCLLGTFISGFLGDRFGRKIAFSIGGLAIIAGGFGIAFITDLVTLNICRFIIGISRMVLWTNALVLGLEIVGPSKRVFAGIFIEFVWCLGVFLLLIFSYLIRQWRYLEIALSVPSLFLLTYWWLIPESPRWLASKGRDEEALKILKKIASSNKSTMPKVDDLKSLLEGEKSLSFRYVFQSRELIVRMLIVFGNMFAVVIIYNALMYNITNLAGDIFLNYLINAVMETAGLCAPYLVLDRLGRKKVYCASIVVGGAICILCVLPALLNAEAWVITALALASRFFVCVAFSTLYVYGAELFPTVIRGSTIGVGVTFSRLGGIISPHMADAGILIGGKLEKALPLLLMGAPAVVAGLFTLWLPETKGTKLLETMEDLQGCQSKGRCFKCVSCLPDLHSSPTKLTVNAEDEAVDLTPCPS